MGNKVFYGKDIGVKKSIGAPFTEGAYTFKIVDIYIHKNFIWG